MALFIMLITVVMGGVVGHQQADAQEAEMPGFMQPENRVVTAAGKEAAANDATEDAAAKEKVIAAPEEDHAPAQEAPVVNNKTDQSDLEKAAKKLPKNVAKRQNYDPSQDNYLSYYDVSVIEFPVAVANVVQPLGQEVLFTSLNENKTLAITVNTAFSNTVQLVVGLENGKTLSMDFELADITGVTYRVSRTLAGANEAETLGAMQESQKESRNSYNDRIIAIKKPLVMGQVPDPSWEKFATDAKDNSPFREFSASDYEAWQRDLLVIEKWELCQRGRSPVNLSESQFVKGKMTLAVTLTKNRLDVGECGILIVLSVKESRGGDATQILQPYTQAGW